MTDDATPNMLTQVYQDQLDSYNTRLSVIGVETIGPEYKKLPEKLYITYDMRLLDKQLKALLGLALKKQQHVLQLIPRSLFSGAIHMRAVRDSNIANLSPRRRLMAGYRGLYAHTQLLSQQVTAMLLLLSADGGAK